MTAVNGSVSPEVGVGEDEGGLQKLQKDIREMREGLRLQRSRNAGPEGKSSRTQVYIYPQIVVL